MSTTLPEVIDGERVVLRRLEERHAKALDDLVRTNLDRLRPWMPWVASEPMSVDDRRALIGGWRDSDDCSYGIFLPDPAGSGAEALVGVCGLHHRIGPGGMEIGYWVDGGHEGRGLVAEAVALATTAALGTDGVERVEIHHDRANARSRAVPEQLGYQHIGERPDEVAAPGEEGVEVCWRATRSDWRPSPQS